MDAITYVVKNVVYYLLEAIELAMLLRAVMSWLPLDDDNKFVTFIESITEPIIYPIRMLLEKFNILQNTPIDFSFFFTYMLLIVISTVIQYIG